MNKKVLIGLSGVLLVLGVLVWQVVSNLDAIVAGVIEDVGTDVLKTNVTVSGVSINLKESKAGIAGLNIANPDGYSSANLIELEGIAADLDVKSLSEDVLVIKAIHIQNPRISYELDESGGSNMQTLLDNMDSTEDAENSSSEKAPLKMIIDRFEFTGAQVKASTALKPGEVTEFKLPAITMSGIGREEGGVTADVVVEKITKELANGVLEAAVKSGVNKVLEDQKKGFMDKLGDKLKGEG